MENLDGRLVIGVSSRALFDLEVENEIFEKYGVAKYRKYQEEHEDEPLERGTAFYLVKSLLELNKQANRPIVEVVVMSRNSPETGMRMLKSLDMYGLDITRVALSGGESLSKYLKAFSIDLFLSKDEGDVQRVMDSGICASALIYAPPTDFNPEDSRVKTDGRFLNERSLSEDVLSKIRALDCIAKRRGQTLAQMGLSWVYFREGITSVLIGASKPEQILENLKMTENTSFSAQELEEIDKAAL